MLFGSSTAGIPASGVWSVSAADEWPLFAREQPAIAPRIRKIKASGANLPSAEGLEPNIILDPVVIICSDKLLTFPGCTRIRGFFLPQARSYAVRALTARIDQDTAPALRR